MKKFVGAAMLAGAAMAGTAGVAHAEGSFSGNVAMTSNYVWRGLTQNDNNVAIQGGFDYTNGIFYAGLWGSSLATGTEVDEYLGIKPVTGPVTWNLGYINYSYPSYDEGDFGEVLVGASFAPIEPLTLSASVYYSPDFSTSGGSGLYYELGAAYALTDKLGLSAAFGEQNIDDGADAYHGSYTNWSLGASYAAYGFGFGVKYTDTSGADEFGGDTLAGEKFAFTVSRAL